MSETKSPNIYDIAKAAGVSIATVSRVLSGAGNVRPATSQRVMEAVEAARYTPNAFARGLGLGSMRMAGILCTEIDDPFYARAVSIIERQLRKSGLDTLLYCTGADLEDKRRCISLLLSKHADAIILVGSSFQEQTDNSHIETAAAQAPVIIINGLVECANTYCIMCDEFAAMRGNIGLLHARGCVNILYLYHASSFSGAQKEAGYRAAHAELGIPLRREYIAYCEKTCESAQEVTARLLARYPQIDAITAAEDLLAAGAGKALADLGRGLPVIGFDNSVYAACATPAITSVDNRIAEMCTRAAELLSAIMAGETAPRKTVLQARLIERETFRRQRE